MSRFFCALLLPFLLAACSSPKPLVYRDLRSFRVHTVSLQQATVVAELLFYNPNNYSLSLKNGDVDAYFNNKLIGKAIIDERTAIPARDTFLLPVSVTANLSSLLANALDIFAHKNTDALIRLEGTVRAGKGGVFVKVPVHYEGRQKIQL